MSSDLAATASIPHLCFTDWDAIAYRDLMIPVSLVAASEKVKKA